MADRVETTVVPQDERDRLLNAMVAATGGTYPKDELAALIDIESDWDTAARNPRTNAAGLIQIMPFHLQRWGLTVDDVTAMTWQEQMRLINRYWHESNALGRWRFPGDSYIVVAGSSGLGKPDSHVVYPVNSAGWRDNPAWREPGGGPVTSGSLRRLLLNWMALHPTHYGPESPPAVKPGGPPARVEPAPGGAPAPRPAQAGERLFWGLVIAYVLSELSSGRE